MPPSNHAAFDMAPKSGPLQVATAPYHTPGPHELLIRNHAFAMNIVDSGKQKMGSLMFGFLKYPLILGNDMAGEVVAIGVSVSRFKVGDRVLAHAMGMDPRGQRPQEGAFQEFSIAREHMTARIPDRVPFASAVVLPLAVSTAASGLFGNDQLALEMPAVGKARNGKTLLVWGASTSVGLCAVQLAVAAGYNVVATASPKNWELVRQLGASEMFDYRSDGVAEDLVRKLRKTDCAGALAIGNGSLTKCVDIIARVDGTKFVSQASIDAPNSLPESVTAIAKFVVSMMLGNVAMWFKLKRAGVRSKFIFGSDLVDWDKESTTIYGFLEEALENGSFKPAPEPIVAGNGLSKIQEGLDLMVKGVSAKKVVVTLE